MMLQLRTMCLFRFHFAKNIFAKVKGKFRLGAYLRPGANPHQAILSDRLRQYMALPLLKPEDMKPQVERLGNDIKTTATENCTRDVVKRFNGLHNYVINYWMKLQGPNNISTFGAVHKTNNVNER